jgi:hypothetical protein
MFTNILTVLDILLAFAGLSSETPAGTLLKQAACPTKDKIEHLYDFDFGFLDFACNLVNCQTSQEDNQEIKNFIGMSWDLFNNPVCKIFKMTQDPLGWFKPGTFIPSVLGDLKSGAAGAPAKDEFVQEGANFNAPMYTDVKESKILSAVCLCIPGYIYNLNKERQIQCQYVNCLIDDFKRGESIRECDRAKKRDMCAYSTGELFNFIPYSQFMEEVGNIIKDVLANPVRLVQLAVSVLCMPMCKEPGTWYTICALIKTLTKGYDAMASLSVLNSQTDEIKETACDDMEKNLKNEGIHVG